VVLRGDKAGDGFGYTVCGAGDLNGDGFPDIAVAASGSDLAAPSAGEVKFYFGGRNMSGRADAVLAGDAAGDEFGISLCAAGDAEGDGLGDVLVGSCWASHRQRGGGITWLARFARHRWVRPHVGERDARPRDGTALARPGARGRLAQHRPRRPLGRAGARGRRP
jgi:hypothetical protein